MKTFRDHLRSGLVQLSGIGLLLWGLASEQHRIYTILVLLWLLWVFGPKQPKPEPRPILVPPEPPVTTPEPAYNEFGGESASKEESENREAGVGSSASNLRLSREVLRLAEQIVLDREAAGEATESLPSDAPARSGSECGGKTVPKEPRDRRREDDPC